MKQWLKSVLMGVLTRVWLRQGTARRSVLGPYRGITFELSPIMMKRLEVFYRPYEANVMQWLDATIRPGMTVYVVGGHIGIHVLYIAKLLGTSGKLYAFEGWPENYDLLERNIALNPHPGVTVTPVKQAVTRESGSVKMAAGSSDGKHHLAGEEGSSAVTVEVSSTNLDDFWRKTGGCPDVVLMDIEGFELPALEGAVEMVKACQPRFAIEHHHQSDAVQAWLKQHGYPAPRGDKRHVFTS